MAQKPNLHIALVIHILFCFPIRLVRVCVILVYWVDHCGVKFVATNFTLQPLQLFSHATQRTKSRSRTILTYNIYILIIANVWDDTFHVSANGVKNSLELHKNLFGEASRWYSVSCCFDIDLCEHQKQYIELEIQKI